MSEVVQIKEIIEEAYDTKTFVFDWEAKVKPGQFIMIWIPGTDEIPMSVSGISEHTKSITVKAIGDATKKLHEYKVGDRLSIRGPFGNGFDLSSNNILIIGGGVGTAAIMPAVVETCADTIIAARSNNDLIMLDTARKHTSNLMLATDDGSMGFHGNAVQLMREVLKERSYDYVIACGPEVMLYFMFKACEELDQDCQLSLERYMKCGAGVCGCCVMDDKRICKDGPVFTKDQIAELKEFGVSRRDECGRIVKFRP